MFGLSSLYVKLIGGAIAALMLLGLILGLKHYKSLAESRGETLAVICQATRDASGQAKLKCGEVPKQIEFMGQAIGTLTTALHKQSDAVAAMGAETARQQKAASDASKAAEKRADRAATTSERLTASARSGERQAKPCEPSKVLEGAWR
jgi:hypothetical protein